MILALADNKVIMSHCCVTFLKPTYQLFEGDRVFIVCKVRSPFCRLA
ncbi:MAG: hypothetical protein ACRC6M_18020 [Microcystaceae cyanobacterium]